MPGTGAAIDGTSTRLTGAGELDSPESVYLRTLDRGIDALRILVTAEHAMSAQELALAMGVHRSIAYRILRTLEKHRVVERDPAGRFAPGVGLAVLAAGVRRSLQAAALPEMADIADELAMTTFLVVADNGEAVTVASVEPRHSRVHVAYKPGIRHPIDHGAPGMALLAGAPARPDERVEVRQARERGWIVSFGEVLAGLRSVAVPVLAHGGTDSPLGALAVVYVESEFTAEAIARRLQQAASAVAAELA